MNETVHTFAAALLEGDRGGVFVAVPLDVPAVLGFRRVPVVATFDGMEYRGSVVRMGGEWIIGVRKEIRERIGRRVGDVIQVTLRRDDVPREVEIPDDLLAALSGVPAAKQRFMTMSYTHKREHIEYITEAKKADTRARRIEKTLIMLGGSESPLPQKDILP